MQAGSYYPWVNENGIWYFKDPDGTIVKGAWREYDKNRYYLNNDGKMAVGWKNLMEPGIISKAGAVFTGMPFTP